MTYFDGITTNTGMLKALGYKLNKRTLTDVSKLFFEKYIQAMQNAISISRGYGDDGIYVGTEHSGSPKLPNITLLPNLGARGIYVLGSTFGHQHTQREKGDTREFQEIYEFLGFGAMLLRTEEQCNLHLLTPGQKVIVPTNANMTFFNMGKEPLLTLDYANPEMNSANKNLEAEIGTLLCCEYFPFHRALDFTINSKYAERGLVTNSYSDRGNKTIRVDRLELGQEAFDRIKEQEQRFRMAGINIVTGGNIPKNLEQALSLGLTELALKQDPVLFGILNL
jgi:hypothetical protein